MLAASGSGAAFSPTLPTYMALRFLCGFSISGVSLSTVILSEPQERWEGTGSLGSNSLKRRERVDWAWLNHGPPMTLVKQGVSPLRTSETPYTHNNSKHNSSSCQY